MKKKLSILVAALVATTSIIATTANAAPLSITVAGNANATTSTYAGSAAVNVPSSNVIDAGHSVALAATADTGTTVSFVASGVKLVTALDSVPAPKTVASGVSSYSAVSQGVAITVYAYTTSTSVGSVTITNGSYSTVVYIHGIAGTIYNVSASLPGQISTGTIGTVTALATDVFGNPVDSQSLWVTLIGATFSDLSSVKQVVTATKVAADADLTGATVWGSASFKLAPAAGTSITAVVSTSAQINAVLGLATPVKTGSITVAVADLNATITGLSSQLASEKASHAADKIASDKALADAKVVSDKALADAKVVSDKAITDAVAKALADAKVVSDKALADANALSVADYNKLVARYNALALSYTAKAKKYKFTTNLTLVVNK
jgi:hypothetical protein